MISTSQLDWLLDVFRDNEAKTAILWRDREFTYGWLVERIQSCREALREHGITNGSIVAIEGDYSPEIVAQLVALIDLGAVIVPLASAASAQRDEFRQIAEVQVVLRSSKGDAAEIHLLDRGPARNPLLRDVIASGHPALVLFSSGSTGKSKAALHDFAVLLRKFKVRRHSLLTLAFLMLDHIGGINTLFYVLANAGTLTTIEGRDPDLVCATIERHRVELLPTSPTFLNLLLMSEAYKRHDLSSLKRITYGTEVMPEQTLLRLRAILRAVEFQQTYGLSEIGILRSKSKTSDCLWVKVGGEDFETKICDGTLWVRAQSAMLGYLNAPSPFDSEGWLNTGDAVEVDGDYIRFLGRASEMINVGGEKVYPVEIENVLLGMPNVKDVAVTGERNPITGQIVVARFNLIQPEDPAAFRGRVREYCADKLARYKIPARIEILSTEQYNARYKKMRLSQGNAAQLS